MERVPLISIITVTYNAADVLPITMRSVAEQTFADFEHIIIDGASKDGTLEVAKNTYSESKKSICPEDKSEYDILPRLVIHSEPDKGIYDGMNKGLRYARGRYVIFLNAGDAFANRKVLASYASSALNHDADIIYGDTDIVDNDGVFISHRHLSVPEVLTDKSFSAGMLICHQAFMVKREIAPEYNLKYRLSADYDWTIHCIRNTTPERCDNLHEVTIHFLYGGATKRHKIESLTERFKIMGRQYGWAGTFFKHITFIHRAIKRKITNICKQ